MKNYAKTIDEIFDNLEENQKEITQKLRELVKNMVPNSEETVKKGGIFYSLDGSDFVRIQNFEDHTDLGFFNGEKLSSLLLKRRGDPQNWRHVELSSVKDVENPEVKRLLEKSADLFQR